MIEMKVRGIAVDSNLKTPAVILTDDEEKRYLPIWIGVAEATAIFIQLNEQILPRPMTHDLLKNILETLGAKVTKVLVNDINQNTFFARIFIESPERIPFLISSINRVGGGGVADIGLGCHQQQRAQALEGLQIVKRVE